MGFGQNGNCVSANLIGGVAIGGNAIRPYNHRLHLLLGHHNARHIIADGRHRNPALAQFPGRQPRPLQQRPRFI